MKYKISDNITETLKTFSSEDIKKFRKFLKSTYLNPYPKVIYLFDALIHWHPLFSGEEFNRQSVHVKMKNGKKGRAQKSYNDSTMRDLFSKLKRLLEDYMAYTSFAGNKFDYMTKLREQLFSRKLHNYIESNIAESEKTIAQYSAADPDYFYKRIRLETEKFNNFVVNKKLYIRQHLDRSIEALNNSANNQMAMFILESIKQNDAIIKITKRQETSGSRNIIPELLKPIDLKTVIMTLGRNNESLSHIFQVYYYLYMLFADAKGENYFHLYKECIIENTDKISADEIHFLFGRLIDYCVNKCNEGRAEYYNELANAYMVMLEGKYYTNSSNKYISQDLFRNILLTAVRTNNTKWAESFINKYHKELHPLDRDNMYNYCYSYIYFESGDSAKALDYILKIKQDYFTLKIDIKILLLKIYFELGMYENIYNQLDSFKHFITNHEHITTATRKKLKDFVKYYVKLVKAILNEDKIAAALIHRELHAKADKQFYKWLAEKAAAINGMQLEG